uniref:PDZ and LIM domain protein Zasp n=1 Tax=Lygus hesperus TaxID=30085 RepID=A0A146LR80_LYGHE
MAQIVNIRLSRADAVPWGFRLQGGKDFGQPLLIQKVNGGSAAERAGLQVGDALVRVNGADVQEMRHKDAQDCIVRAGNNIEMSIQRGGTSTWKPQVSAVGSLPTPGGQSPVPVTKTSLAAKTTAAPVPSGHNVSPRPFGGASTPQMNGGGDVKALVNKQYNSPIGVYSEETIAETLSAQTEVLATGALGVNFMKNEKTYDSTKSEVLKMVQEVEKEPRDPEPETIAPHVPTTAFPSITGLRHVAPPEAQPASSPTPSNPLPPGQNICADCERLIVGVFVRIKDKNLHVECFKCATCGSSLKNVGYYTINNKLYCDIHAKMVARQNPPAPNLDPITVAPGARIPGGAISSPIPPAPLPSSLPVQPPKVARLPTSAPPPSQPVSLPVSFPPSLPTAAPQSPQPGTLAPLPFHTPNAPAPKPFGSVTAPAPAPPSTIQFTPSAPQPNFGAPPSNFSASKPQTGYSSIKPYYSTFYRGGAGGLGGGRSSIAGSTAPRRGRGVLNAAVPAGGRVPLCGHCNNQIRGPFITALGKIWCPEHFICVNPKCKRPLQDIGFVEEDDGLYCEYCFEQYLAPACDKCRSKIKGDCLNAIGKHFHPECFKCSYCEKLFGNNPFFLEDGLPYCENDWNELFTTKCFSCGFPIEAGDRWVEALNNNYHSQCFNCTMCKKNLEGQSFFAKGGRPFCKNHAR